MVVDSLPALRVQPEEYELRSPCFTRAASSSRLPQLPENVIALILDAQHFDDISETLGVSSTCRGFYQYGQRLLWRGGLKIELGIPVMQRQLEAFMDQPRMRPLVKKLDCYINNTEPWTSIQELALRLPLVLGSSVSPAILPLRHLAFGSATLDSDTGELERLFSITEDTLTSISFEVSDQASAVLTRDQPFVTRLHISGKPRSLIFGLGAGRDDAPSNTLLDLLATILPHYPRLESLIIGPNNVPPSHAEGFTLAQKSRWAHQLDAEAFWSALPRTLKTLRLGCVVGRRAKVVMDYLDRAEASRAPLRVLGFLASEGLAVGIRCKELEIRFELDQP